MPRYREKFIEAIKLTPISIVDVRKFIGECKNHSDQGLDYPDCDIGGINPVDGTFMLKSDDDVYIRIEYGDYLIKDNQGKFHQCKADVFEERYELIELETFL